MVSGTEAWKILQTQAKVFLLQVPKENWVVSKCVTLGNDARLTPLILGSQEQPGMSG